MLASALASEEGFSFLKFALAIIEWTVGEIEANFTTSWMVHFSNDFVPSTIFQLLFWGFVMLASALASREGYSFQIFAFLRSKCFRRLSPEWTVEEREALERDVRSRYLSTPEKPMRHFPWNERAARQAAACAEVERVRERKERIPCDLVDDEAEEGSA